MRWLIPISIWSNDVALLLGALFTTDILQLRAVVYGIIVVDVIATIYWGYYVKRRKTKILDTLIYTENGVLNIEGKRQDLEIILSSVKDVVRRTKGNTIKIKLRR